MLTRLIYRSMLSGAVLAAAAGCASSGISPTAARLQAPEQWSATSDSAQAPLHWLETMAGEDLAGLVNEAISRNYDLARQAAQVEEARQSVRVSRASRLPELSAGFDASRRGTPTQNGNVTGNSFSLGLDISWEADVWGKLSDAQRQAQLGLAASEAQFVDSQRDLAGEVARAWFNVIEAEQLLEQFEQRLANLEQDLDIIDQGYQRGVNDALDVYLSRSTVEQERGRVASQSQTLTQARINLQLLLARYPDGKLQLGASLPVIDTEVPAGLPSDMLNRRADIQQAWLNLLAADAALAVAHKQRFPRINLLAGANEQATRLQDVLEGDLAWSMVGGLTQPLFNAGRLASQEEQARLRVVQAEKIYLSQVYSAFAEVENTLNQAQRLSDRYEAGLAAEAVAVAARALSFEQYQRGLVPYTTVLESQRRAFDAQTSVIQLRNQLLQNRIDLYLALGGDYALKQNETTP